MDTLLQVVLPLVRDSLLAAAAVVGAFVAIAGLRTWKKQLKIQSEYELSRRLLQGVLRIRDALQSVRNPIVPLAFEEKRSAYEERLSRVQSALRQVEPDFLEAEVLWGEAVVEAISTLRQVYGKLIARVNEYLWVKNPNPEVWQTVDRNPERLRRLEEFVFDIGRDDDPYRNELQEAVRRFESIVRPRLTL